MTCWVVFNSGDPEEEFAECSVCGFEFTGWPYPNQCPKCKTMLRRLRFAEAIDMESSFEKASRIAGDRKGEIE